MINTHTHCDKCDAEQDKRDEKIMAMISLGIFTTAITAVIITALVVFS